jgi:hypothetical protein
MLRTKCVSTFVLVAGPVEVAGSVMYSVQYSVLT